MGSFEVSFRGWLYPRTHSTFDLLAAAPRTRSKRIADLDGSCYLGLSPRTRLATRDGKMTNTSLLQVDASEFFPAICPSASLPLIEDDDLVGLLEKAAESELDGLVQTLVKKGGLTCQLRGLERFKEDYPHHRLYVRDIAAEIQKYGANTLASQLFRAGKGVRYEEIVRDAASKLDLPTSRSTEEIEISIQTLLLDRLWHDLTPEKRQALLEEFEVRDYSLIAKAAVPAVLIESVKLSGFAAYKMSVIIANSVAHALLGHGLAFAVNTGLTKGLSLLLGPIGWSFVGFMTAHSIAGEAYRVTIPCVLQVSMIRRAVAERERLSRRPQPNRYSVLVGAVIIVLLLVIVLVTLVRH